MSKKSITSIGFVALGYGIALTVYFVVYAAGGLDGDIYPLAEGPYILRYVSLLIYLVAALWAISPFIALLIILRKIGTYVVIATASALSVLLFLSTYAYYESFVLAPPDAQSALILIFFPLYQLISITLAIALAFGIPQILSKFRRMP